MCGSNAGKLLRPAAQVHLLFEELCHRSVVKCDGNGGAGLLHEPEIFDMEQVVSGCDSEAANFR